MQRKVKILLMKPLINKGGAGDIVEVKTHYALQVLVPQGIGVIYDKQAQNQNETHVKKIEAYKKELKSNVLAMVEALKKDGLTFEKQATDNDMLYDSISERTLAQHLMQQYHLTLHSSNFHLEEKIEKLGEFKATFHYEDITGEFTVTVTKKA